MFVRISLHHLLDLEDSQLKLVYPDTDPEEVRRTLQSKIDEGYSYVQGGELVKETE